MGSKADEVTGRRGAQKASEVDREFQIETAIKDAILAELVERGLSVEARDAIIEGGAAPKSVVIDVRSPRSGGSSYGLRLICNETWRNAIEDYDRAGAINDKDHAIVGQVARDLKLQFKPIGLSDRIYDIAFSDITMLARHVKQHLGANGKDIPTGPQHDRAGS